MKVYTKTGDKGETSLFGGTRVKKNNIRLEAYGSIDELNSYIGLIRDSYEHKKTWELLLKVQTHLFNIGSELANEKEKNNSKIPIIQQKHINELENAIDEMESQLPTMKYFILPGGDTTSSYAQIARTVCRRCERLIITLEEQINFSEGLLSYINRLSDYLFVLARFILKEKGKKETPWIPNLEY